MAAESVNPHPHAHAHPAFPVLTVALALVLITNGIAVAQERHLAFQLPGMAQVTRIANLEYRSLSGSPDTVMYGPSLEFDVFVPAGARNQKRPAVIFIHGGLVPDTQRTSPKDDLPSYREWGSLVAAAGFIGITFSHRLNTNENIDVAAGDVEELMRVVKARAGEWGLDPDRICVAAFSAGGPLSSLFLRGEKGARCVVLYYPFMDTEHAAVHSPFRTAHPAARAAELARFSPRGVLLANPQQLVPMMLVRAGRDAIPGINASIDRFVQTALWVNAPLDLYVHPTGPHGLDMVSAANARSAEIVEATVAFFRRHLR